MKSKTSQKETSIQFVVGKEYSILVKPNTAKNEISIIQGTIIVKLQAPAHKNKANTLLIRFFNKSLGVSVRIVKGKKSREKTIQVL